MPVGIRILLYLGTGTFLDTFTVKIFYTKTHVYPNVGGYCTMFIDADKQSYAYKIILGRFRVYRL